MIRRRVHSGALSPGWRHLLETGTMPPDSIMGPEDDAVEMYRSLRPGAGSIAAAMWGRWRLVILADWRTARRRGAPWAETRFGAVADGGPRNGTGHHHENGGRKP